MKMEILAKTGAGNGALADHVNGNENGKKAVLDPASGSKGAAWANMGWIFILIFAVSDMFSISIAQISGALAFVCWVGRLRAEERWPDFTPLKWPMAGFFILSLMAAVFSMDPLTSLEDSKDLSHLMIYFVAFDFLVRDTGKIQVLLKVITAAGAVIALVGFAQAYKSGISLDSRISGFNDIYMTYAGLLMICFVSGASAAAYGVRSWKDSWLFPALAMILAAILLSLTRNAWIGLAAGTLVVMALRAPKTLISLPVLAVLSLSAAPQGVKERFASMFDAKNSTNHERLLVWGSGLKIIKDYPVFGVGQNCFPKVYGKYMDPGAKEPSISHMHNNFLQIAVERGTPTLLAWIMIWLMAAYHMAVGMRAAVAQGNRELAMGIVAGAGVLAAFLSAGFFEYNFGDTEVQMLFLFLLAIGMASAVSASGSANKEKEGSGGIEPE